MVQQAHEKNLNVANDQGKKMLINTTVTCHYTAGRMVIIKRKKSKR